MALTTQTSGIIKQDSRGHFCYSRERRDQLLEEYDKSGLSAAKFASLVGVRYSTFAGWRLRRSKAVSHAPQSSPKSNAVQWLQAVVTPKRSTGSEEAGCLAVTLPCGARIEIKTSEQIRLAVELLRHLEKSQC